MCPKKWCSIGVLGLENQGVLEEIKKWLSWLWKERCFKLRFNFVLKRMASPGKLR